MTHSTDDEHQAKEDREDPDVYVIKILLIGLYEKARYESKQSRYVKDRVVLNAVDKFLHLYTPLTNGRFYTISGIM